MMKELETVAPDDPAKGFVRQGWSLTSHVAT